MSISHGLVRATVLSLALGASLALTPAANAAGFGGTGFHGGGGFGGLHSGFAGGGHRGGGGLRTSGFDRPDTGFHNDVVGHAVHLRGEHRDWHRYGHWENGAWVGIWPDYASDPYDAYWDYYCDPASPYFDPDVCSSY